MLLGLTREDHVLQHINSWNFPDMSEEGISTRTSVPVCMRRYIHRHRRKDETPRTVLVRAADPGMSQSPSYNGQTSQKLLIIRTDKLLSEGPRSATRVREATDPAVRSAGSGQCLMTANRTEAPPVILCASPLESSLSCKTWIQISESPGTCKAARISSVNLSQW